MNFILEFTLGKFGKFCPFSNKTIKLVLEMLIDISVIGIKYNTL